jgi:hypothetical protein
MKFYYTIGFYISYGFQRDIICYFSSYRSKVMNFTRFNWILVWNFHLDRFNSRLGHVASSYWSVPVRLDHELRPLDLMLIGRTRWLHTGSLKWINPGHRINIGWARFIRKRAHLTRVRFPMNFPARARRGWTPVSFRWGLGDGVTMTSFSASRRSRDLGRGAGLRPAARRRRGRSVHGRRWASGGRRELDLLQVLAN